MTVTNASQCSFTPRERELLGHLAEGATDRAIARRMNLSPHTVDTYLRRLRYKTGTSNRIQLAILAHTLAPEAPQLAP